MKSIFIILSIAVMIQVSLAGPTGDRVQTQEDFEIFQEKVEEFISQLVTILKDIIQKMEAKLDDKSKCKECQILEKYLEAEKRDRLKTCNGVDVIGYFRTVVAELDADVNEPPIAVELFKEYGYNVLELLAEAHVFLDEHPIFFYSGISDC